MIRRKIIFSSNEPVNSGQVEEKEVYHENQENMEVCKEEKCSSSIEGVHREIEFTGDSSADRIIRVLRGNVANNRVICIFNVNYNQIILNIRRYLSKNFIIFHNIDMRYTNTSEIYECMINEMDVYIHQKMRDKLDSVAVKNFYIEALKLSKFELDDFWVITQAINTFLYDVIGDENKKIIVPICFEHKPIPKFFLNMISQDKIKNNNIIFLIGTMVPYEHHMELLENKSLKSESIFKD